MSLRPEFFHYLNHIESSLTIAEFHAQPHLSDAVALRHDIDHDLDLALEVAYYEAERGIRATYFLLHTTKYWHEPRFHLKCRQLAAYGHEVALHCNVLTEWMQGEIDDVNARVAELLAYLRQSGVPIVGVSAHGDRCCYQHQFTNFWLWQELRGSDPVSAQKGRCAEGPVVNDPQWQIAYPPDHTLEREDGARLPLWEVSLAEHGLQYDAAHVLSEHYWTDSGGDWTRSGDPLKADLSKGRHQVLMHPWWWRGPQKKVFVLSTARSGSKWLANFVDRATSCRGLHEWTLNHTRRDGEIIADKMTSCDYQDLLEDPYEGAFRIAYANSYVVRQGRDVVEANVYLEPFVEVLKERVPDAQIVHLHRDGRDVVRSLINRNWYGSPEDRRHPPPADAPWRELSQCERACWYYRHINERLSDLTSFRLCFERMVSDPKYLADRLRELGIAVHPLLAAEVFDERINANQRSEFPMWGRWPLSYQRSYDGICGEVHAELGYSRLELKRADKSRSLWFETPRRQRKAGGEERLNPSFRSRFMRKIRKGWRKTVSPLWFAYRRLVAAVPGFQKIRRRLFGLAYREVLMADHFGFPRLGPFSLTKYGRHGAGLHVAKQAKGLRFTVNESAPPNSYVLFNPGRWQQVQRRHGFACHDGRFIRGVIESADSCEKSIRVFALFYNARGELAAKEHVANIRSGRPAAKFAFLPPADVSHFTIALHFGEIGPGESLTVRSIRLESVAIPPDYPVQMPLLNRLSMKICKLAFNTFAPDARIYKEAETLANAGRQVTVLALAGPDLPEEELLGNVRVKRLQLSIVENSGGRNRISANPKRLFAQTPNPPGCSEAAGVLTEKQRGSFAHKRGSLLSRIAKRIWRTFVAFVRRTKIGKTAAMWLLQRSYAKAVLQEVRQLKPDVIHAHDLLTLPAAIAAARLTGAGLVYDAHEMEWDCNRIQSNWILRIWWRLQEAARITAVDALVTVSPRIGELYRNRYRLGEPVIIPNVPREDWLQAAAEIDLRAALPDGNKKRILLYLGSVTADRGVPQALSALGHLPQEFVLVTLGNVLPDVKARLEKTAKKLGVAARFFMLPPVHYSQVSLVSSAADIGIVPVQPVGKSYLYCMPNKLFELMHAGIPLVIGDLPDVRAIVERNRLGIVCDQRSGQSIAEAVLHVCRDAPSWNTPERINEIRAGYSWEAFEPRLLRLYDALISNSARRTRWQRLRAWLSPRTWWLTFRRGPHPKTADVFAGLQPPVVSGGERILKDCA